MRKHKRVVLLFGAILAAAVMAVVETLRAQQSTPQGDVQQSQIRKLHEHLDKFPAADYDAPEDTDPEKRVKRGNTSRKYNRPHKRAYDQSDPSIGGGNNDWEWGLESTLPTNQSSAIIVGAVTDARAFLSEDKTNIYSEYTVRVEVMLKDFADEPLKAGDLVVAERQGGRVRLPSGAISGFFISGQYAPQVGRRYVLFLGYNKSDTSNLRITGAHEMSHHLLTGYEFRGGKVVPLDAPGGLSFKMHEGKDEAAFLDEIRRLLAGSSQTPRK